MNDRYATEPATRSNPNPHDVAKAVLRPAIYGEVVAWLREVDPDAYRENAGYRSAVHEVESRLRLAESAPEANLLDHATAAYARFFADRLDATGYAGAAQLLRHTADDFDGAESSSNLSI